jgi:hypothetical protein
MRGVFRRFDREPAHLSPARAGVGIGTWRLPRDTVTGCRGFTGPIPSAALDEFKEPNSHLSYAPSRKGVKPFRNLDLRSRSRIELGLSGQRGPADLNAENDLERGPAGRPLVLGLHPEPSARAGKEEATMMQHSRGEILEVVPNVDAIRASPLPAGAGDPGARFTVPLSGRVDLAWRDAFYTLQWKSLDAFYYQLDEDRTAISFVCHDAEGPERASDLLEALQEFLAAVHRAAVIRREGGSPPEFLPGLLSLGLTAA